jgi:fused signal recognition particle receptor
MSIFSKFSRGLKKSRQKMGGAIDEMMDSYDEFSDDLFLELEEILVMSDVGVETAHQITEELRDRVSKNKIKSTKDVKKEVENIVAEMLEGGEDMGLITQPSIILMIGVNGAGKTTTIGKLASMYKAQGKKVLLGAADTFRAAAIDQLQVWADRAGVEMIRHAEGSDPTAVVYDTIQAGKNRLYDIIICDTAGRLQNKKGLMQELNKMYRIIDRELPWSDREVLLVLDATTGQNAVNQAKEFSEVAEITGIVLTKLDGTARGGVVLTIKNELKIPVKFIGVGEGIDDLQPFNPQYFAKSLFEDMPDNYKEIDNEVLPVYEKPLDTTEAHEIVEQREKAYEDIKKSFGEDVQGDEEDGRGDVSDGDNERSDDTERESVQGNSEGNEGLDEVHNSEEIKKEKDEPSAGKSVQQDEDEKSSGEDAGDSDLYSGLGKFYF